MTTLAAELKRLRNEGGFAALRKRFRDLNVDHDVPDGLGYNVEGTIRYIDRMLFDAIVGGSIDTGLTAEQTIECLVEHLETEKALTDADNELDFPECVLLAHEAEDEKVRSFGGDPTVYEQSLARALRPDKPRKLVNPPPDLACAMLLENPSQQDHYVLAELRKRDVEDAFKEARRSVDYGSSTGSDQCVGCTHWQDDRSADLSTCSHVEGLVRKDRWCKRFERENEHDVSKLRPSESTGAGEAGAVGGGRSAPRPDGGPEQGLDGDGRADQRGAVDLVDQD